MKKVVIFIMLITASISSWSKPNSEDNNGNKIGVLPPNVSGEYIKPSEKDLRGRLSELEFFVTQKNETENAYYNKYWDNHLQGIYVDIVSGEPLFSSLDKYDSGTGWPSFTKPLEESNIVELDDRSYGMTRVEVRSLYADSHLGHLFDDGPKPTGNRYCINSASLRFVPIDKLEEEGYGKYLNLFYKNDPENVLFTNSETAVLAGGCFWGVEAVYEALNGVYNVESGYSGGDKKTAFYDIIGTGKTGHAESVKIIFNPDIVSFNKILDVFFKVAHDPTQLNYQGPDIGTQYRSVIFYTSNDQKIEAENYIVDLKKSKIYKDPIVTELVELVDFFPAESYHQDFLRLNPTHPYIVYWDLPKLEHLKKEFPDLLVK